MPKSADDIKELQRCPTRLAKLDGHILRCVEGWVILRPEIVVDTGVVVRACRAHGLPTIDALRRGIRTSQPSVYVSPVWLAAACLQKLAEVLPFLVGRPIGIGDALALLRLDGVSGQDLGRIASIVAAGLAVEVVGKIKELGYLTRLQELEADPAGAGSRRGWRLLQRRNRRRQAILGARRRFARSEPRYRGARPGPGPPPAQMRPRGQYTPEFSRCTDRLHVGVSVRRR